VFFPHPASARQFSIECAPSAKQTWTGQLRFGPGRAAGVYHQRKPWAHNAAAPSPEVSRHGRPAGHWGNIEVSANHVCAIDTLDDEDATNESWRGLAHFPPRVPWGRSSANGAAIAGPCG